MNSIDFHTYELGDVKLLSGETLLSAKLAYKTYGSLNDNKTNVILLPTFYTGTHKRNEGFFGTHRAINPEKHFIISVNLFGNGFSSSPSNAEDNQKGSKFPTITLFDNIACQYKLLTEHLNINKIALVAGWSMAGCQSYQWAAQYPDMVEAILPFCSSAKTSEHNFVFLEGVKAALCADPTWNNGDYTSPPVRGLKAFGRVYAGWAFSQSFFRENAYKKLGFQNVEELLVDWENDHVNNWDANNLLTKLLTWQKADISLGERYNGNFIEALKNITAKTIIIPCSHDLYFPPKDNEFEARHIKNSELRTYNSIWGHCVANPGNDKDFEIALDQAVNDLLK
ncbi:MAG: Homoserine O-acetyltransferase [Alphaproteobacteria bacterium MarineAlpha5_Bin5]|nr:MAG: Homoserine O-acetyltransferase [Alphaproteobacteria bacterium MarineAlpha5_Bin5]|tara:strand:+ start:1494 stop:2510 length:1017 start_codon:yes stop_codon:yes gene_type:complete